MKKQITYLLLVMILHFSWHAMLLAQTIETTAGSLTSCPEEILVPIEVTNFNQVGAISLVLNYNDQVLSYISCENLHSELTGGLFIVNASSASLIIVWTKQTGANIGEGTLLQLRFQASPGSSPLNWDIETPGNCEYSHIDGTILPATFNNGHADIQYPPQIIIHPQDQLVLEAQNASFTVNASGTNMSYRWYQSADNGQNWEILSNENGYSGLSTHTLSISNVPITKNGYLYRCELSGTCSPALTTQAALLRVVKPLVTYFDISNICPGEITIPVMTEEFNNVAAFSLSFNFNPDLINYTGFRELNQALQGGEFVVNAEEGTLFMSWASTTAQNFDTNKQLVKLIFNATSGPVSLNWNSDIEGQCEYVLLNGQRIISQFQNKSFEVLFPPEIRKQAASRIIAEYTNTSFGIEAQASGISYRWQLSYDNGLTYSYLNNGGFYSGVTTPTLNIGNADLSLSGNKYRCIVAGSCGPESISNAVDLIVLPKITTRLSSITGCPENTLVVPVNVERFINVSSMSLSFTYDDNFLTYKGCQALNSKLSSDNFVANALGGKVYLTWYNTEEVTIGDDLLVELLFDGESGTSNLVWDAQTDGQCEYSNSDGLEIFSEFINGSATINLPTLITANPLNKSTYDGGNVSFTVGASGSSLIYRWQESNDGGQSWADLSNTYPYSGVTTKTMTINPASINQDAFLYRCRVEGTCEALSYSTAATLTVTSAAIYTTISPIVNSCTANIDLPVLLSNCNNVGGISLTLNFDQSQLSFEGYHTPHSELNSGLLVVNQNDDKIILSWASLQAANIGNGQLITYRFKALPGASTSLTWDTQSQGGCEYSNMKGNRITAFFNNGNVSVIANPLQVYAGTDLTIHGGEVVQLEGLAEGGATPYNYSWTPASSLDNPDVPDPIALPLANTTYTLTVTAGNNCRAYDQVNVSLAGTCAMPSGLSTFNVTTTVVGLQWIPQGTENEWEICYGIQGFDPANQGTLIAHIKQRTHQVEALLANTSYDFYVRSRCNDESASAWTGPLSVSTQNEAPEFFIITATAGNNGTIEPSGEVEVASGSAQVFTIVPDEGYTIDDVLVDGQSVGSLDEYSFGNVTQNHGIQVSFKAKSQLVELKTGWNIISSTVMPGQPDMKTLLQPLIDQGKLRKAMEESGNSLEDLGAFFGGWKNNIGDLESTEGYKVNVTEDCTLELEGVPIVIPLSIPLAAGWNIISFPTSGAQDGKAVVQTLIDEGKLVKVMHESGASIEDLGSFFGGWKNNIGDFIPGKGYKVNVNTACQLVLNNDLSKSALIVPEMLASAYFKPAFEGNGTDHMNIHLVHLTESGIIEGDEIGIFDGALCVGSAAIGKWQIDSDYIGIPASMNDGLDTTPNGYTQGKPLQLRIYRNREEAGLNYELLKGESRFAKGESMIAKVSGWQAVSAHKIGYSAVNASFYPNPFNESIHIDLIIEQSQHLVVTVYDLYGRKIKTLFRGRADGKLQLQWQGDNEQGQAVRGGLYLCRVNGITYKMVKH